MIGSVPSPSEVCWLPGPGIGGTRGAARGGAGGLGTGTDGAG